MALTRLPPLNLRGTQPGGSTTSAPAISDAVRKTLLASKKTEQMINHLTEELASGRLPAGAMPQVARAIKNLKNEGTALTQEAGARMRLEAMPGTGERIAHAAVPTVGTLLNTWLMTDPDEESADPGEPAEDPMLRNYFPQALPAMEQPKSPAELRIQEMVSEPRLQTHAQQQHQERYGPRETSAESRESRSKRLGTGRADMGYKQQPTDNDETRRIQEGIGELAAISKLPPEKQQEAIRKMVEAMSRQNKLNEGVQ